MRSSLVLLLVSLCASAGCLKRSESVQVQRDGSVLWNVTFEGSPQDFATDDAIPSADAGWKVDRETRGAGDQEKQTLRAFAQFAPGEALPSNFLPAHSSAVALQFPTSVNEERRADGLYFHFERVYPARPWARTEYWSERFLDDEKNKKAGEDGWDAAEKLELIQALVLAESHAHAEWAGEALTASGGVASQDVWLQARTALLNVYSALDLAELLRSSEALPEAERDAWFDQTARAVHDEALARFLAALALADEQRARFEAAYELERAELELSKQTGVHNFELRVQLPGTVVASNADRIEADGTAVWEFNGTAFRDRELRLQVTSRLGE